jgi:hypothetical protein
MWVFASFGDGGGGQRIFFLESRSVYRKGVRLAYRTAFLHGSSIVVSILVHSSTEAEEKGLYLITSEALLL